MVKDFLEFVNQDLDFKEVTFGVYNLDQDLFYVKVFQGFNSYIYVCYRVLFQQRLDNDELFFFTYMYINFIFM